MNDLFDLNNFNIIQDDENYYFFRALNMGDSKDIDEGLIVDSLWNIERIRTDRQRYIESSENDAKYGEDDKVSLEEVYDHIKTHQRKDTNCISLSSNANISIMYGRGNYNDKYAVVKVPKRELGNEVFIAGKYMLDEIEKSIEEYLLKINDEKVIEELKEIEEASSEDELKKAIEIKYTSEQGIDVKKAGIRKGITLKSTTAIISSYQALNEKQSLQKNKIIAKLTILQKKYNMPSLIPGTNNNRILLQTIGNAFSSLELIHYGEIEKEKILNIDAQMMDILALVQQVDMKKFKVVEELKKDLIKEFSKEEKLEKNKVNKTSKIEYRVANNAVQNTLYYLAKSRLEARKLAEILNNITGKKDKYKGVIEYISNNCFEIEPQIINKKSGKGIIISESVNLNIEDREATLIDKIKGLSDKELENILESGVFQI